MNVRPFLTSGKAALLICGTPDRSRNDIETTAMRSDRPTTPATRRPGSGRSPGGFSLLELLIVVAVILIIVTIAIPSLLRSRQAANESSAASALQLINGAQNIYMITTKGFGTIPDLIADGLVDDRFNGAKSGYVFASTPSPDGQDYQATATAASPTSGRYDFYTGPDYVLRYTTTPGRAPAGLEGQPVQ